MCPLWRRELPTCRWCTAAMRTASLAEHPCDALGRAIVISKADGDALGQESPPIPRRSAREGTRVDCRSTDPAETVA